MQKYCGCVFSEASANYDHKSFADKVQIQNKITERKIRLGRLVPNLELRPHKNGNPIEIHFIYDLKKKVYKEYVEKYFKEWNEENQQKLFARFMKENSKNIELIYLKDELVGFYNGKDKDDNIFEIGNICVKSEYQNKGIGTAVLKEILFEHKGQNIKLQVFKINEKAIKLYEKMGFEKEYEIETHYIMKKANWTTSKEARIDDSFEFMNIYNGEVMDAKFVSIDEFKMIINKGERSIKNFEDTIFL